ncbi:unnamed protein product [Dovyalis caffra]|uniref:Uncharacterized protein n=1 Tax=Dovyalis caffra TaxID=77055 RepID=A0AAV1RDM2_9ROSI|nr:unnamed protein product [Dovyalis caffra]
MTHHTSHHLRPPLRPPPLTRISASSLFSSHSQVTTHRPSPYRVADYSLAEPFTSSLLSLRQALESIDGFPGLKGTSVDIVHSKIQRIFPEVSSFSPFEISLEEKFLPISSPDNRTTGHGNLSLIKEVTNRILVGYLRSLPHMNSTRPNRNSCLRIKFLHSIHQHRNLHPNFSSQEVDGKNIASLKQESKLPEVIIVGGRGMNCGKNKEERLLGATLGAAFAGFVVFEQRKRIYQSISPNHTQFQNCNTVLVDSLELRTNKDPKSALGQGLFLQRCFNA